MWRRRRGAEVTELLGVHGALEVAIVINSIAIIVLGIAFIRHMNDHGRNQ